MDKRGNHQPPRHLLRTPRHTHQPPGADIQRLLHPISCNKTHVFRRHRLSSDMRLGNVPAQEPSEDQHRRTQKEAERIQTHSHLERIRYPRTQGNRTSKGRDSTLPGEGRIKHHRGTYKTHLHLRQLRQI